MIQKFDPANKNKLDNEWRRQKMPPLQTLEKLGLNSSDTVADIGCGIGYFSIPAAEMLNKGLKVYALDTSKEMLDELKKRAKLANVSNILTIETDEYNLKLADKTITFAFMANVIHEIEDKSKFIQEISRKIKMGGRLAIIEWEKKNMQSGPPIEHRIDYIEAIELFVCEGFILEKKLNFGEEFYGLVFSKV
jgi:ubiquinone/menaquinone biosynthesis C-methylase UbiE